MYKTNTQVVDGVKRLTIKEATYLKNPSKYWDKAKYQTVMIRKEDGSTLDLKIYMRTPIYVKERYYVDNPAKYDAIKRTQVYIVCKGGSKLKIEDYKTLKQALKDDPVLPDSTFAHSILYARKIKPYTVTYDDECNCNHCNTLHLLVWWDQSLLMKKDNYVVLKSNPRCYVTPEGVFDIDTCLLTPAFVALQKYMSFNKLEAHYVCTTFLKQANTDNIKAIIRYAAIHFGFGNMPPVAKDALNDILNEDIIGIQPVGYATLFSILSESCHISKDVIFDMINRHLVVVDSKYNVCFLSYDEDCNVSSVYKMSRYNHSETDFSYNHYVTRANTAFVYCSEEAGRYNTFNSVTVFDHPVEMLSYLTLEYRNNPLVPSFMADGCYISIFNSNDSAVREWLNQHDEVYTMNIATRFNKANGYIKNRLLKFAQELKVPNVQEINQLLVAYANRAVMKTGCYFFRIDGWNTLIKLYLNKLAARYYPLLPYEIKRYERQAAADDI